MLFTKDHEWIVVEGTTATIGITGYAAHALGDVVYVDLPAVDSTVDAHGAFAVVESVKAASDVYSPVSGVIIETNSALEADPSLVNQDAEAEGWFARIEMNDLSELDGLMTKAEYEAFVA